MHGIRRDVISENELLQDQVQRLTAVVREYQKRYLPIEERTLEDAPLAPWMTDPSMLSPLLTEYDSNIKALREQIKMYKEEFDQLQGKSKKIVDENNRLHRELRSTIENQLEVLQQSDGMNNKTQVQLNQLQQKIACISDEKEKLSATNEECNKELQHMKIELRNRTQENIALCTELSQTQGDLGKARTFAEELQKTNKRLKAEHDQFLKTAQIQDSEMDELKSQVRKLLAEVKTCKSLNGELQSHNNKLQDQVRYMDKDAIMETITEKAAEGTINKLQNEIVELDSRVSSYSKELSQLRYEKSDLEEQLSSLQKKNTAIEQNEYQAVLRVKDSVQLVENALLEREQAVIREQQKCQEVSRLQDSMNHRLEQADARRRKEVANAKAQLNKQINQLIEELQAHELDAAEKQVLLEKLRRDKGVLEKQLEKMYSEGPEEVIKSGKVYEELQRRLAKIELSRDEAVLQIETLETTLRRNKARYENDASVYTTQIQQYKKQNEIFKKDFLEVTESRVQLLDEVNGLRKELLTKTQDNANLDIQRASQIAILEQKLDLREKAFETRLAATEESHKDAVKELREMLTSQQKNSAKVRGESNRLKLKLENTVSQLSQQNRHLKSKNEELKGKYNNLQQNFQEMELHYTTNNATLDNLHHLHVESEEKANAANLQVQTLLNREKQLLHDRKSLNREVDKLRLDMSRSSRTMYSSLAD